MNLGHALGWREKLLAAALAACVALGVIYLRVTVSGREELHQGREAVAKQDWQTAITHLDRAIHWYSPGSSTVYTAAELLWQVGVAAESREDNATALRSYRNLRSAFYGVRSFYTPGRGWIALCDAKIPHLAALESRRLASDDARPAAELEELVKQSLQRDYAPKVGWSALAVFSFVAWLGCVWGLIFRALTPDGHWIPKAALRWGGAVLGTMALWLLGLYLA